MPSDPSVHRGKGLAGFANTRWSRVAAPSADRGDPEASLLSLSLRFWYPVYDYLRRQDHAPEAAHRLTRAFFADLVRGRPTRAARREAGGFRRFVLEELERFLAEPPTGEDPARAAETRLDGPPLADLEARHRDEADATATLPPSQALARGFAIEVIGQALHRLRDEAAGLGRADLYRALRRYLQIEPEPEDYRREAAHLGLRPVVVALAVQRLRSRFRELVEAELADTVQDTAQFEAERRALWSALGAGA